MSQKYFVHIKEPNSKFLVQEIPGDSFLGKVQNGRKGNGL